MELARELYRQVVRKFPKRSVIVRHIDEIWAADVMFMTKFAEENRNVERRGRPKKGEKMTKKGKKRKVGTAAATSAATNYKYFTCALVVIDCFSKYLWVIPMKDKTGVETSRSLEKIIRTSKRKPVLLWTDKGPEFRCKETRSVLQKYDIKLYHTQNREKSAIAERVIRTLNDKFRLRFETNQNKNWLTILPTILKEYNEKDIHRTIGTTPTEASRKENEEVIFDRAYGGTVPCNFRFQKPKFKVGQRVRIETGKRHEFQNKFEYTRWSREIFKISGVRFTQPPTYVIKDLKGERIIGSFYERELQCTRY
jgi:transposase InsO family protein